MIEGSSKFRLTSAGQAGGVGAVIQPVDPLGCPDRPQVGPGHVGLCDSSDRENLGMAIVTRIPMTMSTTVISIRVYALRCVRSLRLITAVFPRLGACAFHLTLPAISNIGM